MDVEPPELMWQQVVTAHERSVTAHEAAAELAAVRGDPVRAAVAARRVDVARRALEHVIELEKRWAADHD